MSENSAVDFPDAACQKVGEKDLFTEVCIGAASIIHGNGSLTVSYDEAVSLTDREGGNGKPGLRQGMQQQKESAEKREQKDAAHGFTTGNDQREREGNPIENKKRKRRLSREEHREGEMTREEGGTLIQLKQGFRGADQESGQKQERSRLAEEIEGIERKGKDCRIQEKGKKGKNQKVEEDGINRQLEKIEQCCGEEEKLKTERHSQIREKNAAGRDSLRGKPWGREQLLLKEGVERNGQHREEGELEADGKKPVRIGKKEGHQSEGEGGKRVMGSSERAGEKIGAEHEQGAEHGLAGTGEKSKEQSRQGGKCGGEAMIQRKEKEKPVDRTAEDGEMKSGDGEDMRDAAVLKEGFQLLRDGTLLPEKHCPVGAGIFGLTKGVEYRGQRAFQGAQESKRRPSPAVDSFEAVRIDGAAQSSCPSVENRIKGAEILRRLFRQKLPEKLELLPFDE